ncbi:MAG: OsmC family protein [Chitinophagaceae bacterium]|nr:OsmC family protein [Chitinophagaceae bacterium]
MTASVLYTKDLRTTCTHLQSGTIIETDAPKDNQGLGERFSPTDLVATALGACMVSIMGIASKTHGMNVEGTRVDVEKIMVADPLRRIGEIKIQLHFSSEHVYSDKDKKILEHAAMTCPVFLSLHPDTKKTIQFNWG